MNIYTSHNNFGLNRKWARWVWLNNLYSPDIKATNRSMYIVATAKITRCITRDTKKLRNMWEYGINCSVYPNDAVPTLEFSMTQYCAITGFYNDSFHSQTSLTYALFLFSNVSSKTFSHPARKCHIFRNCIIFTPFFVFVKMNNILNIKRVKVRALFLI